MKNHIKLNKKCEDQFNNKCPYWITGCDMAAGYPCDCKEEDGYCYCLYHGYGSFVGDYEDKLYLKCPFKEDGDGKLH